MASAPPVAVPKRGEVYLVDFDPTVGAEIRKTRPALIIQNDVANLHSPVTIVAAITSQHEAPLYPTEVLVQEPEAGLSLDSAVLLNQIRSVDRRRLRKRLGTVRRETMLRVDRAIEISLGLTRM